MVPEMISLISWSLLCSAFVGLDHLLAVVIQHLTFAGQTELLFAPLNEERFENSFQRTDLLAHGRLGHIINLRRLREALRFRQITKHLQAFNLHKHWKYRKREKQSTSVFPELIVSGLATTGPLNISVIGV